MPRSVKLFLALCLIYVAWLVWWNIGPLVVVSAQRLQTLAQLPADTRIMVTRADWTVAGIRIAIPLLLFVPLAIAAAGAHKNWARWGLVLFLLAGEFSMFGVIAFYALAHPELTRPVDLTWAGCWHNWLQRWVYWGPWAWAGIKLALVVTLFGPGTKAWFRRAA